MNNFTKKTTIQAKFMKLILPIVTVILVILGIIIYQESSRSQLEITEELSSQIVKSKSEEIGNQLNSMVLELERIARAWSGGKCRKACTIYLQNVNRCTGCCLLFTPMVRTILPNAERQRKT